MFRYYLSFLFGSMAVLAAICAVFGDCAWWYAVLAVLGTSAAAFGIDALVALFVRWIPAARIDPFSRFWRVRRGERKAYVRLGIRRWKDKIPEAGGMLAHFSKKQVADRHNNEYLLQFLRETCYAELMHTLSIPLGFLVMLIPFRALPYIGFPVACVNALLQLPPVLVQRYVRPFLISQYRRNEKMAATLGSDRKSTG